jgi:glycosyltransferase involved in cell wall biosynthesis
LDLLREREIPSVMTAHDLKLACPAYKMLNKNGICEKCKDGNLLHLIKNRCIHDSISVSSLIALESAFHKTFRLYKKNLNAVVTPSIFFLNKLKEWGWEEDKLTYIPNFIDSKSVVPNYEAGNYFLYFGRLAPEKGVDTLINAIKKTKSKLIIAGTGPYESTLKSIALDYKNINFVGFKSGKDLWDLIHNSRAVILPSEWYENAPISVLEAYAGGKPVIGANIGGIPEMLKHGDTGFIFESGNEDDLADKISTSIELEDKIISSIGKNAREYVTSTYNPDRYYNDMTNLYYSLGVKKI